MEEMVRLCASLRRSRPKKLRFNRMRSRKQRKLVMLVSGAMVVARYACSKVSNLMVTGVFWREIVSVDFGRSYLMVKAICGCVKIGCPPCDVK